MVTPKYRELWTVQLSTRKEFQLTNKEMEQIRGRMAQGDLGMIELKDGGFKISQIVCWHLDSRQIENQLTAGNKEYALSEEERARGRKKVAQVRESLKAVL